MAANGLSERTRITVTVGLAVVVLTAVVSGTLAWAKLDGRVDAHAGNCDVHHTTSDLDARYMPREVSDERYRALLERSTRIEAKLDRLLEEQR